MSPKAGRLVCDVCDKFGTYSADKFYIHMAAHRNLKPFKCSYCGQRANYKSDVQKHIRNRKKYEAHDGVVQILPEVEARATIDDYILERHRQSTQRRRTQVQIQSTSSASLAILSQTAWRISCSTELSNRSLLLKSIPSNKVIELIALSYSLSHSLAVCTTFLLNVLRPIDQSFPSVSAFTVSFPGVLKVKACSRKHPACVSFRITAVNEAGSSSPSAATDYMLVEDPPEPPRFLDLSQLKDIICKAGDSSTVTVGFKGFPIPNVELSMPEEPDRVLDTTRLTSKLDGDQVLIGNTSAERGDTGLYKLSLRNSLGTASTTFHVTVFDTPAIPSGPVETSVIDREHCIVSWAAPKDDGGKPISGYVVEKCAQGTTNWVKCGSARGDVPECVVSGIKEGDKYAFRVIAQNELGDSKPLETDGYVEMKLPYSVPEKPGDVSCVGHTSESISIAWDQPVSDGGNPITHYVVEKMDDTEGSDWTKVGRTPANNPTMVIPRLEEGHKYHFRVAAVNDAGQGEWQKTLDSLEAREPDIAPKLLDHSQGLRKIRIIKGDPLQINLRYQSSPLPQITIKKNGVDLDKPMDKIEKSGANFLIPASEVTDAGQYEFILSNPLGKCISQYAVEIIDVPSAPSGPLEASNVTPSGCILSWEPPSNTGGAEVQRYVIEAMDTKKGTWEPISKYCRDCSFEVFDLKENNEYKFRVAAVNEGGVSEYLEIEKPIIARAAVGRPEPPRDLQLEKNTFDEVALKWNPPDDHHSGKIIGYQVECRRADEPDEWSLLNTEPIRTNDFSIDSLLPGRSYEFRVSAINSAGVGDPAELSKPVKTKGCNRPPQAPMAPEAYTVGNDFVEIAWEPPSETGGSPMSVALKVNNS
ncbi:hypothetical protein ACOME3_010207 [Neoechinorhynchus agilis]